MSGIKKHKIGIFIPVRLSSKRFPKKAIFETVFGKSLEILINNISKSYIKKKNIVICATKDSCDYELEKLCKKIKCKFFAGSKKNIIERFYKANLKFNYDFIVEVDGDDIMTDFKFIDKCLSKLIRKKLDFVYTSNLPLGMNCKVFSAKALNKTNAINISKDNANGFMTLFYKNPYLKKLNLKFGNFKKYKLRLTLDYIEDIKFFEILMLILKKKKYNLSLNNYIKVVKKNKDITKINFFRNFDYQTNTSKMRPLKIRFGKKIKKLFIN